jgi:hypothetical protein
MFTIEQSFEHLYNCLSNTQDMLRSVQISKLPDTVLMQRLAPDMYPLKEQLRLVCCYAADYLQELDVGQNREILSTIPRKAFSLNATNALTIYSSLLTYVIDLRQTPPVVSNQNVTLVTNRLIGQSPKITYTTAEEMFLNWTWPSMLFHQTIAYAILRTAGFPLGKTLFLLAQRRHFGLTER